MSSKVLRARASKYSHRKSTSRFLRDIEEHGGYWGNCKKGLRKQPPACQVSTIYNVSTRKRMLEQIGKKPGRTYLNKLGLAIAMKLNDIKPRPSGLRAAKKGRRKAVGAKRVVYFGPKRAPRSKRAVQGSRKKKAASKGQLEKATVKQLLSGVSKSGILSDVEMTKRDLGAMKKAQLVNWIHSNIMGKAKYEGKFIDGLPKKALEKMA